MYDADFDYDSESGLLYVRTGDILDIIETDSWVEITCVVGSMGRDKKTDTIFSYGYETTSAEGMVGWFEHYSVDRLIEKTRNYLRGEEMSEDKKSMYGIG